MILYSMQNTETDKSLTKLRYEDPSAHEYLTENGFLQSGRLANSLMLATAELIYVSDYQRTKITAKNIAAILGKKPIPDSRLNDIKTGFNGLHNTEWREAMANHGDDSSYRHPQGESLKAVKERVDNWMDAVISEGKDAIVVTHETILRMIIMGIDGLRPDQLWEANIPAQGDFRQDEIA